MASQPQTDGYGRLPGENDKAWAAFQHFRDLPPAIRTVEKVREAYEESGRKKCVSLLYRWSAAYRWRERARAWDARNAAIRQAARDKALAAYAGKWERRTYRTCESAYRDSVRLRSKALEMLRASLYDEESADGKVVRKPTRWNLAHAALLLRLCYELRNAASEAVSDERPVEKMTDDEREAILDALPGVAASPSDPSRGDPRSGATTPGDPPIDQAGSSQT